MIYQYKKGIILAVLSTFVYALMDTIIKYLQNVYFVNNDILFFQSSLLISIFLMIYGFIFYKKIFYVKNYKFVSLRVFITFINFYLAFYILKYIPLDIYYSIIFTIPTIASLLAVFFLNEKFTTSKVVALFIGFVGVLVIANPFDENFNLEYLPYIYLTMLLAFTTALSGLITRKYLQNENTLSVTFYIILACSIMGFAISSTAEGLQNTITINSSIVWFILALCVCWICGLLLFLKSYQITPLQIIAPTEYVFMLWGVAFGYLIFNHTTTLSVIIGCILIVLSNSISIFTPKSTLK